MEDKRVLGQFHAKISKAKILFDTTSATNQKLRRQANQLQREYENLKNKRIQTEQWEKDADNRMNNMRNMHKEENDRCRRETKELDDLRANRKELQRVKKICQSDLQTKTLQLQELVRRRQQLQATAKSLTEKLQSTVAQKNVLQQQYIKTNKAIQKYDQNIKALTEEIQYAREVITTNTVPVHNVHLEQHSNSREKNEQMGKIKNQSDEEQGMDIQEDKQLPLKKKKLIVKKNRQESVKKSVSTAPSSEPVKNVVRQLAKQVNLKQRHKSLSEKQKIFDRIVKGLHEKSQVSKKDKKKTRVILKKELRKHLQQERIHARKRSADLESEGKVKNQIVQIKNPEKFKKRQINERAKAKQFKNLMGAGLANIRNLIASNTAINIHNQNRK